MLPSALIEFKKQGKPITILTAWDSISSAIVEEAGANVCILNFESHNSQGKENIFFTERNSRESLLESLDKIEKRFGNIDILVNCSQAVLGKPFVDTTDSELNFWLASNIRNTLLVIQEVGKKK